MLNSLNNIFHKQRGLLAVLSAMVFVTMTLAGCGEVVPEPRVKDPEVEPTQISRNLVSVESKDGRQSYVMKTPLMERFELATEPYVKFKEGIEIKTYNDTTHMVESELTADYAHYNETQKIWEARGNVIAHNYAGDRTLYTEQLWWNEKTERIYSDTLVKVVEKKSVHFGKGFEADEGFNQWLFRKPRGQMEVEMKRDTTEVSTAKADSIARADSLKMVTEQKKPELGKTQPMFQHRSAIKQ